MNGYIERQSPRFCMNGCFSILPLLFPFQKVASGGFATAVESPVCEVPLQTYPSPSTLLFPPPPLVNEVLVTMRISPVEDGGLCKVLIHSNVEISEFQFLLVHASGDFYATQGWFGCGNSSLIFSPPSPSFSSPLQGQRR